MLTVLLLIVIFTFLVSRSRSKQDRLSLLTLVFLVVTLGLRTANIIFVVQNDRIINGDSSQDTLFSCSNVIVNTRPYLTFSFACLINIV